METALNLVWLVVSATLLLVGSVQVIRSGKDRSRAMAAVAMVCLICLLFPVISMTDDLNSGSLACLEPSKIKKFLTFSYLAALLPCLPPLDRPEASRSPSESSRLFEEELPAQELPAFQLSHRPPPLLS